MRVTFRDFPDFVFILTQKKKKNPTLPDFYEFQDENTKGKQILV